MNTLAQCPLCHPTDETVVWEDQKLRVILVDEADYPGYFRVIWKEHAIEMTDLIKEDQLHFMHVVLLAEMILRQFYKPDKVNLASLGNQVPHLHWHVIARWEDDPHYPNPIWGEQLRFSCPVRPTLTCQQLMMVFGENLADQ